MKKICIITTRKESLAAFVTNAADYLHVHGDYDISFICSPDEEFERELPDHVHFHGVKMNRGMNAELFRCILQMYKILKKEKFDLVQYSTPNASLYAAVAAFLARVPVRLYCQWGIVFMGMKGFRRKVFKLIERVICALSTCVEPDSFGNLALCREMGLYGEKKSRVVGEGSACGVDFSRFDIDKKDCYRREIREELGIPEDSVTLGFCGRLTNDKGINVFLRCAFELLKETQTLHFIIIGDEEAGSGADADMISAAREDSRFHFTGFSRRVERFMSAMDIYLLPSAREGFGMTVIEAGAMEVPAVAYRIPGPMESISDGVTGVLAEKGNEAELFDAVKALIYDEKRRAELGKAARARVHEKYNKDKLFYAILKDRERLLGEKE